MRKSTAIVGLICILASAFAVKYFIVYRRSAPDDEPVPQIALEGAFRTAKVTRGRLIVWNHYSGRIGAEKVVSISSDLGGPAVIVYLVPQGARVRKGDVLVRFDSADEERDLVKLKQDDATAKSELNSLVNAELPIDLADIKTKLAKQQHKVEQENKFLQDSETLQKQGLLSQEELDQERGVAQSEDDKLTQLQQQLALTKEYEDPAKIEQAKAKVAAADEALHLGEQQIADSTISAPVNGVVTYKPLNIASEYRSVHLGDTVYKNQPFMILPDTHELIVDCEVPESDFDEVSPGMTVVINPLSRPDMAFNGVVQSIETVASSAPDLPSWQRYFHAVVRLEGENIPLYSGMSASVNVLSYDKDGVVLMPRAAIHWNNGHPYALERGMLGVREQSLELGHSDDTYYEVLGGAAPGDTVLVQ